MTRLEELTLNLADDALTESEAGELQGLLEGGERAREAHVGILRVEAGLRASRRNLDLAPPVMVRLHTGVTDSVVRGVMSEIKAQPSPNRERRGAARTPSGKLGARVLPLPLSWGRSRWSLTPVRFALAACITLAAGLGVWLLGPTMGEPALAEVRGTGLVLERGGQSVPAIIGTRLQAGDKLRTPSMVSAVIGYAPERTRLTLQPGTDLTLARTSHGKRFALLAGKLDASVARQRPFRPMIITTPQAEARVVGTRFSSLVTNDVTRLDVIEGTVRFTGITDGATAKVTAGHYAVAAANYELAALPQTGGLLREWWYSVKGQPRRPDSRDTAPNFELTVTVAQTNQVRVRLRGFLQPPITGDYRFWLEQSGLPGSAFANLLMSPTAKSSEGVLIAQSGGPTADKAPPPIPLVAGRSYYVESQIMIPRGGGHFSITWQPPGGSRQLLTGEFMSPFKPK